MYCALLKTTIQPDEDINKRCLGCLEQAGKPCVHLVDTTSPIWVGTATVGDIATGYIDETTDHE